METQKLYELLGAHFLQSQHPRLVLQNSRIGTGSIFENIAAGANITRAQAMEAAQKAGLADDIALLPMGLHTVISEGGTNLSGFSLTFGDSSGQIVFGRWQRAEGRWLYEKEEGKRWSYPCEIKFM